MAQNGRVLYGRAHVTGQYGTKTVEYWTVQHF